MHLKNFIHAFIAASFIFAASSFANDSTLKIIFAGDLMGHGMQISAAKREANNKGYEYKPVFKHLKPYFSSADLAVINLEYPLAGEPYTGFPQFSSPDESVAAAKDAGFTVMATANNHSLDRGKQGLERTISVLDSMKIKHFGIYKDSAQRNRNYPLFIEKKGIKLAFLSYTYGTNGIAQEFPNIVNQIDTALIAADIKKAQLASPDFIIAFMHWGSEYENTQNKRQSDLAHFMAAKGVNLIIGGHPHVVQPFDKIYVAGARDSVPVIYSLGNFFSNQRKRYTNGGIAFEAHLQKTKITSHGYMPFWVYSFIGKGGTVFRMLPECKKYPSVCSEYKMKAEDKAAMELFFADTGELLKNLPVITPLLEP